MNAMSRSRPEPMPAPKSWWAVFAYGKIAVEMADHKDVGICHRAMIFARREDAEVIRAFLARTYPQYGHAFTIRELPPAPWMTA